MSNSLSSNLHALFERSNLVSRDPPIESAENSQHRVIDFLNVPGIRRQRSVIHDTCGKPRLINRELHRQAASVEPAERTDVLWVHIRAIGEIVKCRFQIAYRALLPKTTLEFASFRGIGSDFALVEIHGKRDVPIRRQLLGLFLHPLVQTPPFMNDNYRPMAPRITSSRREIL